MDNQDQSNADDRRLRIRNAESRNASGTDDMTSACGNCGERLSNDRPTHRVVLEIEDRTRSTKQFMGDETNIKRLCLDRKLCERCWNRWYDRLASE